MAVCTGALIGTNPYRVGNTYTQLLTANQAGAETDTTGMVTAGTNCTLSRSATRAAKGSNSFRLSSTVAGDMSSTTTVGTGGFAVTAGTAYGVITCGNDGASSRVGNTALIFYDSGGTKIADAYCGVEHQLSTVSTEWNVLHDVVVAPAGATYAALKFAVAATAAGSELHYFDNSSVFAVPAQTLGYYTNLVPNPNVGANSDGWVLAGTNCTGSRSTTAAPLGICSLRLSSTASGDMSTTTSVGASGIPAVAGTTYTALALSIAGASARSASVKIIWYKSDGTAISTSSGATTTNSTSANTLHYVTDVAPALTAYMAIADSVASTGAGSELHYFGAHMINVGTLVPTSATDYIANYFCYGALNSAILVNRNINPSAETNATGWTSDFVAPTRSTGAFFSGAAALSVTATSSQADVYNTSNSSGVCQAGATYTAIAPVLGLGTTATVRVGFIWYNSVGSSISSVTGTGVVSSTTVWAQATIQAIAPAAAVRVRYLTITTGNPGSGNGYYQDAVTFYRGSNLQPLANYLAQFYCDGSLSQCGWAAATDSQSYYPVAT